MGYFVKVFKNIAIIVLTLILIFLLFKLAVFYIPFLIGFIISLLIEPIIRFISKKTKLMRRTSAIIVLLVIFLILISFIVWGIITLVTESTNLLQNINTYIEKIYVQLQKIIESIDISKIQIPEQLLNSVYTGTNELLNSISVKISKILTSLLKVITFLPIITVYIIITILSTYFICTDRIYIQSELEHHFPKKWIKKLNKYLKKIISTLGSYLKAQAKLILISFVQILIGLYVFKYIGLNISYPLLAAIGIGFVDALPILGAGSVMIPWAIISSVNGDIKLGIALFILYAIVLVVHQILEPKIVSSNLGIHPIFTLIAMYTGFKIVGLVGLFIGPIVLIILQNVFETMIDNGIVKSLFEKS